MSFNRNKAQSRYFQYLESKGKLPQMADKDSYHDSEFEDMEEPMPGYYDGGRVDEYEDGMEDNLDYEMGHATSYDSAGEPHTEDKFEDEQPMEFMSRGGMVKKRMSRGGKVPSPGFAKALKKAAYR